MKLEQNRKMSSGKQTHHLNIKYFFLTNQIEKGNIQIKFCPMDDVLADFMTKPLTGKKFQVFCGQIMGTITI